MQPWCTEECKCPINSTNISLTSREWQHFTKYENILSLTIAEKKLNWVSSHTFKTIWMCNESRNDISASRCVITTISIEQIIAECIPRGELLFMFYFYIVAWWRIFAFNSTLPPVNHYTHSCPGQTLCFLSLDTHTLMTVHVFLRFPDWNI